MMKTNQKASTIFDLDTPRTRKRISYDSDETRAKPIPVEPMILDGENVERLLLLERMGLRHRYLNYKKLMTNEELAKFNESDIESFEAWVIKALGVNISSYTENKVNYIKALIFGGYFEYISPTMYLDKYKLLFESISHIRFYHDMLLMNKLRSKNEQKQIEKWLFNYTPFTCGKYSSDQMLKLLKTLISIGDISEYSKRSTDLVNLIPKFISSKNNGETIRSLVELVILTNEKYTYPIFKMSDKIWDYETLQQITEWFIASKNSTNREEIDRKKFKSTLKNMTYLDRDVVLTMLYNATSVNEVNAIATTVIAGSIVKILR